jgi:hypothetical protein
VCLCQYDLSRFGEQRTCGSVCTGTCAVVLWPFGLGGRCTRRRWGGCASDQYDRIRQYDPSRYFEQRICVAPCAQVYLTLLCWHLALSLCVRAGKCIQQAWWPSGRASDSVTESFQRVPAKLWHRVHRCKRP